MAVGPVSHLAGPRLSPRPANSIYHRIVAKIHATTVVTITIAGVACHTLRDLPARRSTIAGIAFCVRRTHRHLRCSPLRAPAAIARTCDNGARSLRRLAIASVLRAAAPSCVFGCSVASAAAVGLRAVADRTRAAALRLLSPPLNLHRHWLGPLSPRIACSADSSRIIGRLDRLL
ncbi:hypothetical protein Scep_019187 [Stephania cephalantha]|uniref:Uncharacterized protein n=1 Tax=Stephania cephalantha TaxID=152367 RepID=A0AAP0NLX2_9MAGN